MSLQNMIPIECLHKKTSIEEIEQTFNERMPIQSWLNKWEEFKKMVVPNSEIWSYSATYDYLCSEGGYAIVECSERNHRFQVITEVITTWIS